MIMVERNIRLNTPLHLRQTLGSLQHGHGDPCVRFEPGRFWRASRTPTGPSTLLLQLERDYLKARGWGPGAEWTLDRVPELIGEDCPRFITDHPVLGPLAHRFPGMRVPRSLAVFEACVPSILEQRVTGMEAKRAYRWLVRDHGEVAPGPAGDQGLQLPPSAKTMAALPSWAWHRYGVERKRAETVRRAAEKADRLEEAGSMTSDQANERLQAISGIGPWTAAEVAYRALGDSDAVSVGDYHFKNWVSWALAGEPRGDDDRMLELLSPFAGHRGRVIHLIGAAGIRPPKWGPRYSPIPIAKL